MSNLDSGSHMSDITGHWRVSATPPTAPLTGDMYWNSNQKALFRYDGTKWTGRAFTAGTAQTASPDDMPGTGTHYSSLENAIFEATTAPTSARDGQMYYDTSNDTLVIYDKLAGKWYTGSMSTTTSTSTSTTTTSTSSTTTSTSSSTSQSTSTSTSTSTTTTL